MGRTFAIAMAAGVLMCFPMTSFSQEDFGLEDLLGDIPVWDQFYTIRVGAGFNDNLLLSDLNKEQSVMLVGGFDATIFRLPIDDYHFTLFANLDSRLYPEGKELSGEATALLFAEGNRDIGERWQGGISAQYFFQDQVIDASVTEINVSTLPVRGHQLEGATDWEYRFSDSQSVKATLTVGRQLYQDQVLDDFNEFGGDVLYTLSYGERSEFTASYELTQRLYDTREQFTTAGTPITGSDLRYLFHNVELGSRHYFDSNQRWRLRTRLGYGRNTDNGPGYFDFSRYRASVTLRFREGKWELQAGGLLNYYDYDEQLSDENPGELRRRTMFGGELRAQRELRENLRAFLEYRLERATSNLSFDKYTLNLLSAGVDWEF